MQQLKKYRDFSRSQKNMPIFSKDWYLDAVYSDKWNVVTVERNNRIVASLPYVLKEKAFFKIINHHFFTQTMGAYIHPDFRNIGMEMKLMKELIDQLPTFDAFDQNFHYQITNWLPFKWEGFQQTTSYTYTIDDITNLDQVWKGFSSNFRNRIKKAKDIVAVVTDCGLEKFYEVAQLTFERQQMKMIYDFEFLQQFDKKLVQEKRRKIFFAKDKEDRIHAVLYVTLGDEYAHFHLAGEDPSLRNSGAGMYLVWKAIQYASQECKLKGFDFQGSVIPSIEIIRRKSGATQKSYSRIWKYNSKWFKILKSIKG